MLSEKVSFSTLLDMVRFSAALLVLFGHCNYSFLPSYEAVIVFFVLSGYLISSNVSTLIINREWSWKEYIIKRMTRLYVVLIPALLLSCIIALILIGLSPNHLDYQGSLSIKSFIGNLLFFQKTRINSVCFALNQPLWSLSFEFWYYLLFPSLFLFIYSKSLLKKLFYLCISFLILYLIGNNIALYFIIWMVGFLVFIIKKTPIKSKILYRFLLLLSFLSTLFFMEFNYLTLHTNLVPADEIRKILIDLAVAFSLATFLYLAKSNFGDNFQSSNKNIWKSLSGFSYTLYLTHYPMMLFIFSVKNHLLNLTTEKEPVVSSIISSLFFLFTPLVIIYYAWMISKVTEAKTSTVKRMLFSYFSPSPK